MTRSIDGHGAMAGVLPALPRKSLSWAPPARVTREPGFPVIGATRVVRFRSPATTCWALPAAERPIELRLQAGRDGARFDIARDDGGARPYELAGGAAGDFVLGPGERIVLRAPRRPWNVHSLTVLAKPTEGRLRLSADRLAVRVGDAPELTLTLPAGATGHVGFLHQELGWIGTVEVAGGKAVLRRPARRLRAGTHRISASYGGDAQFLPGDAGPLDVTVRRAVPYVALTTAGAVIVARLPREATGTVVFFHERHGQIGIAKVADGTAALTSPTKLLPPGRHRISVRYCGDADFQERSVDSVIVVGSAAAVPS